MSDTMSTSMASADTHPIGLIVTDDLQRNRLTVFFRLLLAIPHFIVVILWGVLTELIVLVAWFAALFTGQVPDGLHNFIASWLRYATRVTAYVFLLADPFPQFGAGGSYPVDVRIDPAAPQSRLTVFFRIFLAIPALLAHVRVPRREPDRGASRLVLFARDRTHARGDAEHQRMAPPLRDADVGVRVVVDGPVPQPRGSTDGLGKRRQNLCVLREAVLGLLREHELAVHEDVELGLGALDRPRRVAVL